MSIATSSRSARSGNPGLIDEAPGSCGSNPLTCRNKASSTRFFSRSLLGLSLCSRIFQNAGANLCRVLPRVAWICLIVAAGVASLSGKDPRQIREDGGVFVGSVGCKSSSCHGGAGPKRSQYITWSQKDFHTKAYAILLDARSDESQRRLGLRMRRSRALAAPFVIRRSNRRSRPACQHCASRRRGFVRDVPRRGGGLVAGSHPLRLDLQHSHCCRHA